MTSLYVDLETEWRGGQGQALLTLRWLRKLGQPAELVAARGCPLAQRAAAEGIVVHEVGALGARWQCARLLRRLLGTSRYALVHANEPHALTAAWLARAHRRVPLVFSRRVAYPLGQSPLALARYRAATRILAISRFVAASIPWKASDTPDLRRVAQFLTLLCANPNKKIFVHCHYGGDRTGTMLAAYRIANQGWTPEQAYAEMRAFSFHWFWHGYPKRYVFAFPRTYSTHAAFAPLSDAVPSAP